MNRRNAGCSNFQQPGEVSRFTNNGEAKEKTLSLI